MRRRSGRSGRRSQPAIDVQDQSPPFTPLRLIRSPPLPPVPPRPTTTFHRRAGGIRAPQCNQDGTCNPCFVHVCHIEFYCVSGHSQFVCVEEFNTAARHRGTSTVGSRICHFTSKLRGMPSGISSEKELTQCELSEAEKSKMIAQALLEIEGLCVAGEGVEACRKRKAWTIERQSSGSCLEHVDTNRRA